METLNQANRRGFVIDQFLMLVVLTMKMQAHDANVEELLKRIVHDVQLDQVQGDLEFLPRPQNDHDHLQGTKELDECTQVVRTDPRPGTVHLFRVIGAIGQQRWQEKIIEVHLKGDLNDFSTKGFD